MEGMEGLVQALFDSIKWLASQFGQGKLSRKMVLFVVVPTVLGVAAFCIWSLSSSAIKTELDTTAWLACLVIAFIFTLSVMILRAVLWTASTARREAHREQNSLTNIANMLEEYERKKRSVGSSPDQTNETLSK